MDLIGLVAVHDRLRWVSRSISDPSILGRTLDMMSLRMRANAAIESLFFSSAAGLNASVDSRKTRKLEYP